MVEVTPLPGDCCKDEMELRGGGSLEATLQLSIDSTGLVTTTSVLQLGAIQAYPHTVGYN